MEDINKTDDFSFYLDFTRELIVNLPEEKDRSLAELWLEKLKEINDTNENVHVEYLKLLIIAMHGNNFSKFFVKPPTEGDLAPINNNETFSSSKSTTKSKKPHPFVYTAVSGNYCDFVSVQEIPNFGIQGYFAISTEPVPLWIQSKNLCRKRSQKEMFKQIPEQNNDDENIDTEKETFAPVANNLNNCATKNTEDFDNNSKNSTESIKDESTALKETNVFQTKPCWCTNRCINELINEPDYSSDFHFTQAEAFLGTLKNREPKITRNSKHSMDESSFLPSKRKQN